jgi:hypothetical protein
MPPKRKGSLKRKPSKKPARKRVTRKPPTKRVARKPATKRVAKTKRVTKKQTTKHVTKKPPTITTILTKPHELTAKETEKCKDVENLIGPIELNILDHPQTGARIVLLSDKHVDEKKCPTGSRCGMPIWTYLENVFKQFKSRDKDDFLDFFLEYEFAQEQRDALANYPTPQDLSLLQQHLSQGNVIFNFISSLRVYFHNCWERIKTQCEFHGKQIRFHYSDVRSGAIHKTIAEADKVIVKQLQEIYKVRETPDKVKEWHIKLLLTFIDKFEQGDIDYFFRLTKIDKQLKRIENKSIVPLFYEYVKHDTQRELKLGNFQRYREQGKEMLENVRKGNPPTALYGQISFLDFVRHIIGGVFTPLFDVYTLARMIRLNMKKVIIYAGWFHINDMKRFLIDKLGFRVTASRESTTKDSFQCISLKGVPQPWFPNSV